MLNNFEWLMKIVKENPNLPIIPVVDGEITNIKTSCKLIERNRWLGCLGDAEILMYISGNKNVHFYGDCNFEEALVECGGYTQKEIAEFSVEELENAFDELPWQSAIFLNIDCIDEKMQPKTVRI